MQIDVGETNAEAEYWVDAVTRIVAAGARANDVEPLAPGSPDESVAARIGTVTRWDVLTRPFAETVGR